MWWPRKIGVHFYIYIDLRLFILIIGSWYKSPAVFTRVVVVCNFLKRFSSNSNIFVLGLGPKDVVVGRGGGGAVWVRRIRTKALGAEQEARRLHRWLLSVRPPRPGIPRRTWRDARRQARRRPHQREPHRPTKLQTPHVVERHWGKPAQNLSNRVGKVL